MQEDPEINAMQVIYTTLKNLEEEGQLRVINWAISKLSLNIQVNQKKELINPDNVKRTQEQETQGSVYSQDIGLSGFSHVAELFGHASPKTDMEKALVVAAYLQETQGLSELTSRLINDELKHMGHGASNITVTLSQLISRKPNLIIQTRKEGKSQQAQKKYRVTTEGLKFVMEMLKNKTT